MYVPSRFAATDAQLAELLRPGLVDLVTATADGLLCTPLPVLHVPAPDGHGSLVGHLARNNPQWRTAPVGAALAIARGPHGYVSPSWYASKREHGRVVPTWDYVTAHVYGRLVVHDDVAWVEHLVRRLTAAFEDGRAEPWSVDDAPAAYTAGQLRAIVGVELVVTRVEAQAKLSQNRSPADVDGVVAGLRREAQDELADAVDASRQD